MGVPTRQCNRSREFRCKMADAGRFLAAEVSAMALVPPGTRGSSAYAFLHRARGLRYRRSGQTFKQFPIDKQTMEHVVHMHKNTPSYNKYFDVRPRGPNNSLNSSVRGYAQCQRHSSDPALSKRREGPLCGLTVVDLRLPTGDRDLKDPPPGTQKKGASNCGVCRKPCSFLPLFDCRLSSARAGPDSNALVFD